MLPYIWVCMWTAAALSYLFCRHRLGGRQQSAYIGTVNYYMFMYSSVLPLIYRHYVNNTSDAIMVCCSHIASVKTKVNDYPKIFRVCINLWGVLPWFIAKIWFGDSKYPYLAGLSWNMVFKQYVCGITLSVLLVKTEWRRIMHSSLWTGSDCTYDLETSVCL